MKIKKRNLIVVILIFLLAISAIWLIAKHKDKKIVFSEDYIMAEELAPLLKFTYYDKKEWEEQIGQIAKGTVNFRELEKLLDQMGVRDYVSYEAENGLKKVPRAVFFQVYEQIMDLLDVNRRVTAVDRIFLGAEAKEGKWLTQEGYETIAGGMQYIHPYDMYRVYTIEGEIVGMEKRLDTSVTWENVFIHSAGDGKAQVLFEKELLSVEMPRLAEPITDTVCDVEWKDGAVHAIYKKEDMIRGTVLSYNESQIEIASYGSLEHGGDLKIYKTYGTVEQLDESKLIIGNLVADFVVAKGKVCGIILKEPAKIQDIRVLLLNGESPYYPDIYMTADQEADVSFGDAQKKLSPGTVIKASDYWKENQEGYLKLEIPSEEGEIFLTNEKGETVSLGYQGSLEVRRYSDGYCVVNQLSLEDYLCAVVPSEMPASYEMEALRAQAVCARSYACIQLGNSKYAEFGANVDDSTNYQVYNKQKREEKSTLAVRDTVGEVMKYHGEIAEAYYYSTSCGFSQNVDVWNEESNETNGYLKSISLLTDGNVPVDGSAPADGNASADGTGNGAGDGAGSGAETDSGSVQKMTLDLSKEDVFTEFIQKQDYTAYDSDAAYFRWQAQLDLSANAEKINEFIRQRKSVNPNHIQVLDNNGNPADRDPAELGKILSLTPKERSAGGVLKKMLISYEKGSILVTTEYNIRKILGAAVISMTDKNGKAITSMTLLPSAAFSVVPAETEMVLYGGGYGHGIGLSQNGANGMAKAGFTYTDILRKFYQDIVLENIYNSPDGS